MTSLKDKILSQVSEWDIFRHYMNLMGYEDYTIRKNVRSPFRKDRHPSFGIYKGTNGHFYFKDFAGEQGDCFKFVELYYEVYCGKSVDFKEVLFNISSEMNLNGTLKGKNLHKQKSVVILPEVRRVFENMQEFTMTKTDIPQNVGIADRHQRKYMEQYGVLNVLNENIGFDNCVVKIIDDQGIVKREERFISTADNPVFTFEAESFMDDSKAFRIYQPMKSKDDHKHYGNVKSHHIYNPVKTRRHIAIQDKVDDINDILVLLGGYKDAYLFNELTPFNCCATGGESWTLHPSFVEWIKQCKFKPVIFYDSDVPGMSAARKLSVQHNYPYIIIDNLEDCETGMKDFSDFARGLQQSSQPMSETGLYQLIKEIHLGWTY